MPIGSDKTKVGLTIGLIGAGLGVLAIWLGKLVSEEEDDETED